MSPFRSLSARVLPLFFLSLISICSGCGYLRLEQPTVTPGQIEIKALSFEKADLLVPLEIQNPNVSTLVIAGYTYDLRINDASFLSGRSDEEYELKPKAVTAIRVPISVDFQELRRRFEELKGRTDTGYRLEASLALKTPVGSVPLVFHKEGRLPVLSPPQIRLKGIRLGSIKPGGVGLELLVEISDPGPQVKLRSLRYKVGVQGSEVAIGKSQDVERSADGSLLLRLPLLVDLSKVKGFAGALLGAGAQEITIAGTAEFESPYGPISIPFTRTERLKSGR